MTTHPIHQFLQALNALPGNMPAPELTPEEDGNICFDWQDASDVVLSITLGADGRVGWSALIKEHKSYGHGYLPELPDGLKDAVRHYVQAVA